jgi:hypothetical protein
MTATMTVTEKQCKGPCGETKPLEQFHKSGANGRQRRCKACSAAWSAANYQKNKEKIKAQKREYRSDPAVKEAARERSRSHYYANREKMLAYSKKYNAEHAEEVIASRRRYYLENTERLAAKREANRERTRAWYREHYKKNREAIQEKNREWKRLNPLESRERNHRRRMREASVESDGHTVAELHAYWLSKGIDPKTCFYCDHPISNWETSEGDHVVPISRNGPDTVENLLPCCSYPSKARGNCQNSKGAKLLSEWTPPNMEKV